MLGLDVHDARAKCNELRLVLVSTNVDGPPLGALTWPGRWIVTQQSPQAGDLVSRGDTVTIDFRREAGGEEAGIANLGTRCPVRVPYERK